MANTVNITNTSNTITVTPQGNNNLNTSNTNTTISVTQETTNTVTVSTAGPQGPKGVSGESSDAASFNILNTFTGSIQTEVDSLTAATSSYITESTDISSLNTFTGSIQTQVDNLTAETSSYITDISSLNTFTGSIQTEVDNLTAATSSYITESTNISALNTFTSSIQTEVDSLTAATSSYITESVNISALNTFTGSIQTEVDNLTAATSSYITESTDISALNTFTGSIQTEVDSLTAETSSYLTSLPNGLISESQQITNLGFITESIPTDISSLNTFTGSIQTEVDSLIAATSSYLTESADISALNTFTGSIQTEVDSLIAATSSYLTELPNNVSFTQITGSILKVGSLDRPLVMFGGSSFTSTNPSIFALGSNIIDINAGINLTSTYKLSFDNDTTNTYIAADTTTPENLEIHADGNIELRADDLLEIYSDINSSNNLTINQITSSGAVDIGGILSIPGIANVSASIAAAVAGTGADWNVNLSNIPSGLISESQQITDLGFISESADISALNTFTGSIQTEVDSLTAATSSYITESTDISSLNTFTSSIQTEVDSLIAATSSYLTESADISSLNTFTSSIQTEVNNLTAETSSYLTELPNGLISESAQFTTSDNFNVGQITSSKLLINPSIGNAEIILDAGTPSYSSQIKFSSFDNTPSWILGMDSFTPQDFRILKGSALNNANGIYITGSTGYVGLGSLTPYERLTVVGNISASGIVYGLTGSFSYLQGNSPITVKDNITFEGNVTIDGAKTTTDSLEITNGSFTLGGGIFTSSSLAAAVGGGGDNLGNHTAEIDLNLNNKNIINASSITAVSFTGSISTSSIEGFNDSVNSLAQNVFDARDQEAIDALIAFTGSIQTEVDNLTAVTGSYALTSSISGAFAEPSGGFSTRITTLETAGYITEATDISSLNTFTGSIQTEVNNLTAETSSYLTSPITTSSITDFNTEVSRSAAAAGFGTGGEESFTPSLSTDIEARNITASNDISSSGVLKVSKVILPQNGQIEYDSNNYFRFGVTNVSIKTSVANYDIGSRINFFGSANVGINPSNTSINAPEKLTVGGNISASGNFIGNGLVLAGGDGVFTSASLASAIAGSDNLGNHTASLDLNMGGNAITNVGNVDGVDIATLKSDFDTLLPITTASITNFPTEVSRSAAAAGFGTGGSNPTDISALNTFTGSIQTEVDSLTAATSSYITESTDISSLNTFTSSIQTEVDSLTAATSSYLTSPITTSSITDFNTEVSRSAAAAGFGTGGEGTPTDISALNTFTGSIQTEVDNLTAVTGSYALTSSISGAFAEPSGGFSTRVTTLETAGYFIPGITVGNNLSAYNILANDILAVGDITASGDLKLGGGTFTSASLAAAQAGADNLGNHTATTTLNLDNNNIISASNIEATSVSINGLGVPTVISNSNINLSASNAVVINSSPLRLSTYTNSETGSGFSAGDIYFNTDTSKFMGYNGSNHVELG